MKKVFNEIFSSGLSNLLSFLLVILILGVFVITQYLNNITNSIKSTLTYKFSTELSIQYLDRLLENITTNNDILAGIATDYFTEDSINNKKKLEHFLNQIDSVTKNLTINSELINGSWVSIDPSMAMNDNSYYVWYYKDKGLLKKFPRISRKMTPQTDPYYYSAFHSKKPSWSEVYVDKDVNLQMITYSFPLIKNNKTFGVAGFDLSLKRVNSLLSKIASEYPGSELYLTTNSGKIISSFPLKEKAFNRPLWNQDQRYLPIAKMINKNFTIGSIEFDNKITILSLLSNRNYLIISIPSSEIYRQLNLIVIVTYFLFCLLVILAFYAISSRNNISTSNTKLKQQTKFLQNLIDSIPDLIVIKDVNLKYISCNKFFIDFIGKDLPDIIGKNVYDLYPKIIASGYYKDDLHVLENKQSRHVERWMRLSNGQHALFDFLIAPLFDDKGEISGLLAIGREITERKKAELEIMRAKELAEMASNDKATFLANMSHEIRTPMNGVIGFIQLLLGTNLSPEQKDLVVEAKKSSESLLVLINDILDFSKIQAGKMELDIFCFNLHSAVEEIASMLSVISSKKGVELNTRINSNVPTRVWGDAGRLKQVLNNLIGNAVKFTDKGEVLVSVDLVSEEDNEIKILFEITDTGLGITEEQQQSIFDVFVQADKSTTRRFGGSGLGLPIARNIIELMNGNISLTSERGIGSTFSFTLQFEKEVHIETEEVIFDDKANILLLGDTTTVNIAKSYLDDAGYSTHTAKSCMLAQNVIAENEKINVVIIDYNTYKNENFDIIECKKHHPEFSNISIIMLTSLDNIREFSQMHENDEFVNILKPIKKTELLKIVGKILNKDKVSKNLTSALSIFKNDLQQKIINKSISILLVEDNETNQKLILKILEKVGYDCDVVTTGIEAIEAYSNNDYDLILMDCQLPEMDGYEATKNIRELENFLATTGSSDGRIPIIALTANSMEGDDQKCINAGMDNYISKPFDIDKFFSVINNYLPINNNDESIQKEDIFEGDINESIALIMKNLNFSQSDAKELLGEFVQQLPDIIAGLRAANDDKNFELLTQLAHTLKGTSANLRVENIRLLALNIENAGKNKDFPTATSLLDLMDETLTQLSSQL